MAAGRASLAVEGAGWQFAVEAGVVGGEPATIGEPPALRDLAHGGGGGGVGAWIWWSSSSFVRALDTSLLALAEEEFEAGAPRVPLGTSG